MIARVQMNLRVGEDVRRLLEMAAACESRPLAAIVEDAVRLYVRSRSDAYRDYLDAARRYCEAPDGSDEKALALDDLVMGISREAGEDTYDGGGDVAAVRARLRKRQAKSAAAS